MKAKKNGQMTTNKLLELIELRQSKSTVELATMFGVSHQTIYISCLRMKKLYPSLKDKLTKRRRGGSIYKDAIRIYSSPNYRFKGRKK